MFSLTACGAVVVPDRSDAGELWDGGRNEGDSSVLADGGLTLRDGGLQRDASLPDGGQPDSGPRDGGFHRLTIRRVGVGSGRVFSAPPVIDCGDTCSADVYDGATVELVATAEPQSRFRAWSNECGEATCSVRVGRDLEISAAFEIKPKVSAGPSHTCALSSDGGVRCWGRGRFGALGSQSESNISDGQGPTIVEAGPVLSTMPALEVIAGSGHSCALLRDRNVSCWGLGEALGRNSAENVGDGTGPSVAASGILPIGDLVITLASTGNHSCALLSTRSARCWGGFNSFGELGYGHTQSVGNTASSTPIIVAGDIAVGDPLADIVAGGFHTCALTLAGTVKCWGRGSSGQLGYGNSNNVLDGIGPTLSEVGDVPVGGIVRRLAAGLSHTCAILDSGAVRCWGEAAHGQLGYGDLVDVGGGLRTIIEAGDVPLGFRASAIACGAQHTCAQSADGLIKCWGRGTFGRLGYDDQTNTGATVDTVPAMLPYIAVGGAVAQIDAGSAHTCAVLGDDSIRCWGNNDFGQLGRGNTQAVGDGIGPTIEEAGGIIGL